MPKPNASSRSLFSWLSDGDTPAVLPTAMAEETLDSARRADLQPTKPRAELNDRLVDEGEIARGGMCSIRKVFNHNLLRHEAMKALDPRMSIDSGEVLRFLEEAQITGQLDHPNIPPVHEVGVDGTGVHYFTMKLVEGRTLEEILADPRFSPTNDLKLFHVLQVFIKVCQGLAFAHSRGVVHCDLKPENIMVGSFGQVYVMDWGISRLVHRDRPSGASPEVRTGVGRDRSLDHGKVMGTLSFMSPEQARGETDSVDERSDVFALGAMLYRMLTGSPPYVAPTVEETWSLARAANVCEPEDLLGPSSRPNVLRSSLPWKLCRLSMEAMSPDPSKRPAGALAFADALEDFLRGAGRYPVQTFPPGARIVVEGDVGETAYVIAKGRCQAFKMVGGRKVILRDMGPGEVFGETAILTSRPRSASVEAVDEVNLVVVSRASLDRELGQTFYAGHILKELANRFRDVDERLTGREQQTLDSRVAELVLSYMNFRATPTASTSRVTPWGKLRSYVARHLDRTDDEVLRLAMRMKHLRINEADDTASLLWDEGPALLTGTHKLPPRRSIGDDDDDGEETDVGLKRR